MKKIRNQIPNLLTLANLLCGIFIIIYAFQLQFITVAWLAAAALVFDFLDGTVARMLLVSSPLGKELDSMADVISFGAAPALVLYNYWSNEWTDSTSIIAYLSYLPLLIAVFAGYRLAKFNITEQSNDFFLGLPTPALALACFTLPLAAEQTEIANLVFNHAAFKILFSLLGSYLLISHLRLFSLKLGSKNKALNSVRIALVLVSIILVISLHFFGAFLCFIAYLIFSAASQKIIT